MCYADDTTAPHRQKCGSFGTSGSVDWDSAIRGGGDWHRAGKLTYSSTKRHASICEWPQSFSLLDCAFGIGALTTLRRSPRCLLSLRCGTSHFVEAFRLQRPRPFFFAGSRNKNPGVGALALSKIEGRVD